MTLDAGEVARRAAGPEDAPGPSVVVDRRAAFEAGAPKMPRKVIYWGVAAVLVLGVGGALVDRVITSHTSPSTTAGSTPTIPAPAGGSSPPAGSALLHAPLPAFLGLTSLEGHKAAPFSLTDAATGATVSLSSLRGHVVVLSFANAACNDICPVVGAELQQADALLGHTAVPVTFVTVNSDPLDVKATPAVPILASTSLASLPNWRFLTGSVTDLDPVWVSYGISISADKATGVASHNDLLYFIAPDGSFAWSATPFADESKAGSYSLPAAETTRFAQGIAHYADQLAGSS